MRELRKRLPTTGEQKIFVRADNREGGGQDQPPNKQKEVQTKNGSRSSNGADETTRKASPTIRCKYAMYAPALEGILAWCVTEIDLFDHVFIEFMDVTQLKN